MDSPTVTDNRMMESTLDFCSFPDEVLEMIFKNIEDKKPLAQVCQRWEIIVDELFGLPVKIYEDELKKLSTLGVSKCTILKHLKSDEDESTHVVLSLSTSSSVSNFSESDFATQEVFQNSENSSNEKQVEVVDQVLDKVPDITWKYPSIVQEIRIEAVLTKLDLERLLVLQQLRSLNKLSLIWIGIAEFDTDLISNLINHYPQLKKFKIYNDSTTLQCPSCNYPSIRKGFSNVLEFLNGFARLESLKLQIPEPKDQKGFTKSLFDFLEKSTQLKKLHLEFDQGILVTPLTLIPSWTSITVEQLNAHALLLAKRLRLKNILFGYMGYFAHKFSSWINLITLLQGLEWVDFEVFRKQHTSLSVVTSIVGNNLETLKGFRFSAGPGRNGNVEDRRLDFAIFKDCKVLEKLQFDVFQYSFQLFNIKEANFPPMLSYLELGKLDLTFKEIYELVISMKNDNSTLDLEDIYMEDREDELEQFEQIRMIAEKVIEMNKITDFSLGRLTKFPVSGFPIGPPGHKMQILTANQRDIIHLVDFEVIY